MLRRKEVPTVAMPVNDLPDAAYWRPGVIDLALSPPGISMSLNLKYEALAASAAPNLR